MDIKGLKFTHKSIRLMGGEGSGHHGHAGRPGSVGGSASANVLVNADFAANWYLQNDIPEDTMSSLEASFPFEGKAYRGLSILDPGLEEESEIANKIRNLEASREYQDYLFLNKQPPTDFKKEYETVYKEWVAENVDTKSKWTSWSSSKEGLEYYRERTAVAIGPTGSIESRFTLTAYLEANVKGIDLAKAVSGIETFHASSIENAKEIVVKQHPQNFKVHLFTEVFWGVEL